MSNLTSYKSQLDIVIDTIKRTDDTLIVLNSLRKIRDELVIDIQRQREAIFGKDTFVDMGVEPGDSYLLDEEDDGA